MDFEIDVSGEDLLNKNYTICIANKDSIIKGFKFNEELVRVLSARYGQGLYKGYKKSAQGKANLKIRVYCIIIYYLFKSLNLKQRETISLNICRDFEGRSHDVEVNLEFFLGKLLNLNVEAMYFVRLDKKSNADRYASL